MVNTPGVRRGGDSGGEEERSRGIPMVEDNLVEEELDYSESDNKEEITNTVVEKEEGERHQEEDFGEHLEFQYQEVPVFIGDYAISDEFP